MPRVLALWESIRTTYWALPSLMTLAAVGLTAGMIRLDGIITAERLGTLPWVYAGGAEGARAVLSTIAGSMSDLDRLVLLRHAAWIAESATDAPFDDRDQALLDARCRAARTVLDRPSAGAAGLTA